MKKYEIMYIINASLDEAQFTAVQDRLHQTITNNQGTIDNVDDWGIKEFAYEIDHMKKGHYVVINVTAKQRRYCRIPAFCLVFLNNVVRIMVVKTEDEK